MGNLRVSVLGPLEVTVGGERLSLGGRRQERLLALLLLNANSAMTPAQVIDALWEDAPPATARSQVHNTVARLRRDLGAGRSAIVTDGKSYRIEIDDDHVDLLRFSRALAQARELDAAGKRDDAAAAVRAGLELWRGAPFAGLGSRVLEHAAAKLEEERLAARELLVRLRLDGGDTAGLIAELTALITENPVRETLVHLLMTVLYRQGRAAEALLAFESARARFADELGVDPGPELRQLHEQILRNDPGLVPAPEVPAPAAVPRLLPRDIADFTGRTEDVDRLVGLVRAAVDTAVVITALDGMPGVGKTTLAVHAGHRLLEHFPDGQVFLDLHGYTPGHEPLTPAVALDLLLRAIGVPPEQIPDGLERRADVWRSSVAGRQLLVVLDNAQDTAQVRTLLPGTAGARVLVTSRRRLTMLEGASSLSVDLMPREDAVELFLRVAGRDRAGADPEAVAEVVALCGYLPLAIRIAASRLRTRPLWTVAHLAELLRDEDSRLAELATDDRSVGAAFTVSYRNLPESVQRSFRLLGLIPGGDFDGYTAAAVAGLPVPGARRLLDDLVDVNLLSEHQPGRYHFHDLVRHYARGMAGPRERTSAAERIVVHYRDLGHAADLILDPGRSPRTAGQPSGSLPELRTAEQVRAVAAAEHRNVLAVLELAARLDEPGAVAELASVFGPLLQRQGFLDETLKCYEAGLSAAQTPELRATLHRSNGLALISARKLDAALQSLLSSLAIEEELANAHGAGRVYTNIGIVHIRRGRFAEALTVLRQAFDLLRDVGTRRDKAAVLVNLGVANIRLGHYAEAIASNRAALAENAELGNTYVEATALLNLGHAQLRSDLLEDAAESLVRSRRLSSGIGATEMEARSLYLLADCHRRQLALNPALESGRAALILAREIVNRDVQSNALVVLGQVHFDSGDLVAAAGCFQECLRLTAADGDNFTDVVAHDGLAKIARVEGDPGRAERHWRVALTHAEAARLPIEDEIRRELAGLRGSAPIGVAVEKK